MGSLMRHTRMIANLGLLLGALTAGLAAMMPWWNGSAEVIPGAVDTPTPAGQALCGVLAGVIVAGWLLSATLPARARQVTAVLLALVGLIMMWAAFTGPGEAPDASLVGDVAPHQPTGWHWAALPGGMLTVAGAVAMVIGAPSWRRRADRFDRQAPETISPDDDPADLWKAMDAGLDPTADDGGITGPSSERTGG